MRKMKGSQALIEMLLAEGVDTVFGYPGGSIMPVYDSLYDYQEKLRHVLVRHEQAASHAAEGYARVSGKTGVCIVTSGPGATNTITGIGDAMMDSTPIVVIAGQVGAPVLGTDAFQEIDVVGITQPITKWSYQIRRAQDIPWAVARAFYIARSGRPGPVVLDFTKNAQTEEFDFKVEKCSFIRSYIPPTKPEESAISAAAALINSAKKPLALIGQGVILGNAESELRAFLEKADIPAAWTLLGASALPNKHRLAKGMLGMHGNVAPNMKTNECDVLLAIGMRFDDRVIGTPATYAKQAKVIHLDIDGSEFGKNVPVDVPVLGDVKFSLPALTSLVEKNDHSEWISSFEEFDKKEFEKIIKPETQPENGALKMGEVISQISSAVDNDAILVTDVGQNQMMAARYFKFSQSRSMVTSGGLGTMGYGLPAAIGAKIARPDRKVCFFCGDGGLQMTIEEFGTIMQDKIGVKMVVLNNNWLGNVRQWQEMFFSSRYSQTRMQNPDFQMIASAYGIKSRLVETREELSQAIAEMFADDEPFLLIANVEEQGAVLPMIAPGHTITDIIMEI